MNKTQAAIRRSIDDLIELDINVKGFFRRRFFTGDSEIDSGTDIFTKGVLKGFTGRLTHIEDMHGYKIFYLQFSPDDEDNEFIRVTYDNFDVNECLKIEDTINKIKRKEMEITIKFDSKKGEYFLIDSNPYLYQK